MGGEPAVDLRVIVGIHRFIQIQIAGNGVHHQDDIAIQRLTGQITPNRHPRTIVIDHRGQRIHRA